MRTQQLDTVTANVSVAAVDAGGSLWNEQIGLSLEELRSIVADLSHRRPLIYWTDFLCSLSVGYIGLAMAVSGALDVRGLICIVVAAVALYRATIFTHELVHAPKGQLDAFRIAWNVVCGIPLLLPTFLYEMHGEHHSPKTYGTEADGEYMAFASLPTAAGLLVLGATFVSVPALAVRFLVLAPASWAFPALRRVTLQRASALVINPTYRRALPASGTPIHWVIQEAACFAWCVLIVVLFFAGLISGAALLRIYCILTAVALLNAIRVLAAHRYRGTGARMPFLDQVLDSNDFPGWAAAIWAPLGLQYHAMHHLVPGLPYHSLAAAYRRLSAVLPFRSSLHRNRRGSLSAALRESFFDRPSVRP
jgi:fatty acid desaturase